MDLVVTPTSTIRRIQGLIVLMSCLPSDGKCRELFELALALDSVRATSLLTPPGEPSSGRGHQPWLESLWARADLSPAERRVVEWQNSPENMEVAIREIQCLQDALAEIWQLH